MFSSEGSEEKINLNNSQSRRKKEERNRKQAKKEETCKGKQQWRQIGRE